MRQVIDQEIFSQSIRAGVESAPLVEAGHLFDESLKDRAVVQHKGIDGNPLAGHTLGLLEGLRGRSLTDPSKAQRPFAV